HLAGRSVRRRYLRKRNPPVTALPGATGDRGGAFRHLQEFVPCVAASLDNVGVDLGHAMAERIGVHELPDVLARVSDRANRWAPSNPDAKRRTAVTARHWASAAGRT